MSTSPHDPQDEGADKQSLDELEDTNHVVDADAGMFRLKSLSFTAIIS
jgi:high mobility group AT-hook protein 2